MKRKLKAEHEKQRPAAKLRCTHYWVIESPKGPMSIGICKFCGAVSEFSNYVSYPSWENKVSRPPRKSDFSDIEVDEESDN